MEHTAKPKMQSQDADKIEPSFSGAENKNTMNELV